MMRNLCAAAAVLMVAGVSSNVTAARADTAAQVRKELQANYNDRDAAFGRRDLDATLAHYAPEFVGVSSTGKTHDLKEERLDFQKTFTLPTRSSVTHSTIEKLAVTKASATVLLHRHGTLILVNPQTSGSNVLVLDGIFADTWVKRASGWLLTREQASSVKATMNGKPL